jgi:hypothetical protein
MNKGKSIQNGERTFVDVTKVATIQFDPSRPVQREHLAIGDGFYVKCDRKAVMLVKFGTSSNDQKEYAKVKLP